MRAGRIGRSLDWETIALRELVGEPMVLLDLPMSRAYFRALFLAEGLEPNVQHRSRHFDVVHAMVGNGFGYSLVNHGRTATVRWMAAGSSRCPWRANTAR